LFGEPSRVAEFKNPGISLQILKWDADKHPEQVAFYATVGRSERTLPREESTHPVELFTGLLPEMDDVVFPLADLVAAYDAMPPGSTFAWRKPLWEGILMDSFLVSRPVEPIVPSLEVEGVHVLFDQAIPLFPSERAFVIENGAPALRERWRSSQVPFWNPHRAEG
jgi:hypothetical protein